MTGKKLNVMLLTLALSFVSISYNASASNYNFGYACRTNGHWTQAALQETQKLIEVLESLKDDENCKGLETIVADLMKAENRFERTVESAKTQSEDGTVDGIDEDNLDGQKSFLNSAMINDVGVSKNKGSFFDLLAGVHMSSAVNGAMGLTKNLGAAYFNKAQVIQGLNRSAGELTTVVNTALTSFVGPKLDQCLVEAPEQGLLLVSGMLRLVANTSVPGVSGAANRIGETIANFVQYMRQAKFGKVLRKLKQNELWASITCALESSAENYCTVRDQMKLLKWGLNSMDKSGIYANTQQDDPAEGNFLTGYYTLIRNVPVIAKWLLKVQFGVEPKLMTDATYKNSIWETVIGIISSINDLKAVFNEYKRNILNSTDLKTQKNMIFGMMGKIRMTMDRAVVSAGGSEINFYTNSLPMKYLALVLVGMEEADYPKDVLPKESGLIISAEEWLQNGGRYQPMFDDPIKLLETIKLNMEQIIDSVQDEMRKYFIDRLIVDKMNLVAEAYTIDSMGTSVDDSIKIILRYLEGLKLRIETSPFGDEQVVHLIEDTLIQLSQVAVSIDEYGSLKGNEKEAQKAAEKVIETVYEEFNVLIQRDSFITNRMATLVHYDYFLQVLENKDIGQYERDLMIISNNEAYQQLMLAHAENPAQSREDYHNAMMIHRRNIDQLEYIFRDNFLSYLQTTIDDAKGRSIMYRNGRSLWNMINDNILALPMSIFGYKYRYKMEMVNPFNPEYKRGGWLSENGDNDEGSFMANRNRTCIQLLASPKPLKVYFDHCADAVMTSPFYEAAETKERKAELAHLNASFHEYIKWKTDKTDDDRICAYRDYLRRNHVHWLSLQHEQIKKHKRKAVEGQTQANNILERAKKRIRIKQITQASKKKKDLNDQLKEVEFDLKKLENEAERTRKKIDRRKENLVFFQKGANSSELRKKREEIMALEDLFDELEDRIAEKEIRINMLETNIIELSSQIEELKEMDANDL